MGALRRAVASVRAALPSRDAIADVLAFAFVLLLITWPALFFAIGILLAPPAVAR